MNSHRLLVFAIIFLACIDPTDGLWCYICKGTEGECANTNQIHTQECQVSGDKYCYKHVQTQNGKTMQLDRGCSKTSDDVCKTNGGVETCIYSCSRDYCNDGNRLSWTNVLYLVMLLQALFVMLY